LSLAAKEGNLKSVNLLLRRAGSNITANINTIIDPLGNTPLHYIVRFKPTESKTLEKFQDIMGQLLKALSPLGDVINFKNIIGETPLHEACFQANNTAVEFILRNSGKIDALTEKKESVFHYILRGTGNLGLFINMLRSQPQHIIIPLLKSRGLEGDCLEMAQKYSGNGKEYLPHLKKYLSRHKNVSKDSIKPKKRKGYLLVEDYPRNVWLSIFSVLATADVCSVSFVCKLFFGYARDQEIWISLSRIEYTFVELFNVPNSFLPNPRTIIPELYSASSDHRKKGC